MTDHQVTLTIDGQQVRCSPGSTIYEAATAAGIDIPTFCHHEKLEPVGACRMCLVEIEGVRGLQTSCTTPVRDGMFVQVHTSPAAVKAREANIEFLLTNHPLDCPVCDKGGECPLQNQALLHGPGQSRYVETKRHKNKRYPLGELIVLDQERCVLCWRCIRFLEEWAGDHELGLFGRGADTRIDTISNRPLRSKWQGNTIDICPVGALTSRVFRFGARVWELTESPSICPMCSVGCNISLGVKNNTLRRIVPRENPAVNDSWICDKGRFTHGFVDHPDRLTSPLIRRSGKFEPASWEDAFALISREFKATAQECGPQAIAALGSTRVTNEANYLFQRFMRTVVGSNSIDHMGRVPPGVTPLSSLPDLEHRDAFLLLAFDPSTEAPMVELWIKKAALRNGASVIAANQRRIELTQYGGRWLAYRPYTGAALLNGLARVILDEGLESKAARVTNMDEYRSWLTDYSPGQVEQLTGVPAEALRRSARSLAEAKNPIILLGPKWVRGPFGQASLDAVSNLALLLGGIEAGFVSDRNNSMGALEMGAVPDLYPGRQPLVERHTKVRSRLAGLWGGRLSPVEGLDFRAMISAASQGELKAMWIMGADPASESPLAGDALARLPFLVVQDLFMSETASLAEVVLPAASFAETDGSYINVTGRLQVIEAAKRPPGQAQSDWRIIAELARQMVDESRRRAWDFESANEVLVEISKVVPGYRGVDLASIGSAGWQPPVRQAPVRRALARVAPELVPSDPDYPLTLVPGRVLYDRGTLLGRSEPTRRLVPEAFVMVHPTDAQTAGREDGDDVTVESTSGRLSFILKVSSDIAPGVAFAPINLSTAPLSVLYEDRRSLPRVRILK